jgi:ribulose bisphosphate carboxylase small subunit
MKGFLIGVILGLTLFTYVGTYKNQELILEIVESQALIVAHQIQIIGIMREKKTVVVDSLIINLPEGVCNDNNNNQ